MHYSNLSANSSQFIPLMASKDEAGQIGFLSDLRRMNVAITRARMKLIIIGDASTLSHHPFYRKLYQYIQEKGKVIQLGDSTEQEQTETENNSI